MSEPWISMTAEDAVASVKNAMQQMLADYVVPIEHAESYYFYQWFVSANASGHCNLRPAGQQVCQHSAFAKLGGRHVEPTECLHLAGLTFYLCEDHVRFALTPEPWVCSLCLEPSMFSEPVQL